LRHPNIICVHHVGVFQDSGQSYYYIVMELLPSGSLSDLIKKQGDSTSLSDALGYMLQIASGMSEAHKSIVHRDLKPDNVLLAANGVLKITDFGLAKYVSDATRTQTFKGWGTVAYMAPECWLSEKNTPRMDIYSMGIMYFEILTGVKPYSATTDVEWRNHHLYDPLPDLKSLRKDAPDRLIDTISKMTSKRAENRYPDGTSLLTVLNEIKDSIETKDTMPDPLVSKARAVVNQQQTQILESQRKQDLANQESRLQDAAIGSLFEQFSKRIDHINGNLEQAKIEYRINSTRKFSAEFLGNIMDIGFFASEGIGKYISDRKHGSIERQRKQYGMVMMDVSPSALERDAVMLVGVVSVAGSRKKTSQPYGANLLLRKTTPDDLYGEW
ncbi:MAG: serine/threonine-protein kinase, partial [Pseudomonadota bacterium]